MQDQSGRSSDSIDKVSALLDKYKGVTSICNRLSEMENGGTLGAKVVKYFTDELQNKRDTIMTILEPTLETLKKEMEEVQSGISILTKMMNIIQDIPSKAVHENGASTEGVNGEDSNNRCKTDVMVILFEECKKVFSICDRLSAMENVDETMGSSYVKCFTEEYKKKRDTIVTILEPTLETLTKEMDEVQSWFSSLTTMVNTIQENQSSDTNLEDSNKRRKTEETSNEFENTVYVTNVNKDASREDVKEAFESKYGSVSSVRLHGITPLRKIAYVVFQSKKDATKAKQSKDDFKVRGRIVKVKSYRTKKTNGCKQIYCGDCPPRAEKDDVKNAFKDCGVINKVDKQGTAWIVLFHEEEAADKAVAMNEKCLFGNDIKTRVDYDSSKM
ncbi:hypothetical protein CTEN210_13706 [Chaetoceros tenuissimus]|uniref:RRM domain-containing protein n=1 Tax=Chaetoceros tenuissimus TaxID=426638 RepID=A0AAD3HB98_9STRA|nr:hypothetical protein CTEN210_13706 [Chaetoceros tenuissimus]